MMTISMLAIAACGSARTLDPADAMSGTIVARFNGSASTELQSIHVKTAVTDNCGVIYTINAKTKIQTRTAAGVTHDATTADLVVGAAVRVWAPFIAESCPAQATATTVELIK